MTTGAATWVPHGPQVELVRVGLDPDSTIDDLMRVYRSIDVAHMEWNFAELLPLFAARFGCEEGRIVGFRRRHFYVNTIAFARINDAVDLLAKAGIACVLGGGLAAMKAYPDLSCRSLPDAELIVCAASLERARTALIAAGWTVDEFDRMCHETGSAVRLSPRLRGTAEGFVVHVDEIPSTMTTLTGRPLPIITPAVCVVETAVAAVWLGVDPPIRWVVDLDLLLGSLSKADVASIVGHARDHRAAQLVRVALQAARRLGARSVPSGLLRQLALVPSTAFERDAVTERTGISRSRFWMQRLSGR